MARIAERMRRGGGGTASHLRGRFRSRQRPGARWFAGVLAGLAATFLPPHAAQAQGAGDASFGAPHLVIPQLRVFTLDASRAGVALESVRASVSILDRTASTTLDIALRNSGARPEQAELLLPVPEGSVVSQFLFEGAAREPTARVLPRDDARRTYQSIVSKLRDPALVEFAGWNLVRTSVFPVPPNGTQRVRLTYEHLLGGDGNRIDYALPRSELLASAGVPWEFTAHVRSKVPVSTVFSPSHALTVEREGPGALRAQTREEASRTPGPFLLSVLLAGDGVTASLFAYPDPKIGGGYFLLLAGLPAALPQEAGAIRREVTLVLDRSGSMAGPKMEQVRAAARQVLESLRDGEAFNIIDYSTAVSQFAPRAVAKDAGALAEARRYLDGLRPMGGTNLHDALVEALRQPPTEGCLPIVLFLTDGLPTVGALSESAIREAVEKGNPHRRRVFTFGVGADVNAPLLDRLAEATRAASTYILPGEDITGKVAQVGRRLAGPVLADGTLVAVDPGGRPSSRIVHELIPDRVPDLFEGDPFVLLGQYRGEEPVTFRLSGNVRGRSRTFSFTFPFANATTRNAFVPRLWASRRIAVLIDQIRQMAADAAPRPGAPAPDPFADPRFKELTDEVLRLSTAWGILTEYTAFLATEGVQLADWNGNGATCGRLLNHNAQAKRSGLESISQSANITGQKGQSLLNYGNGFWDQKMNRVEISSVQQVCDRALFRRGNRWIDSKTLANGGGERVDETVEIGSEAWRRLVERLSADGRQGLLASPGETLVEVQGRNVLVK